MSTFTRERVTERLLSHGDRVEFGRSGDWRIEKLAELSPEEYAEALYGQPAGG